MPVVIAGGPKLETEHDALELAYKAMQEGARGVDMGRNIWQSPRALGMIRAVKAIVHEGASVKAAAKILGGGGGGKPELAQGGGPNAERLDEALAAGREAMRAG